LLILIPSCSQEENRFLTIGTGTSTGNYDKTGLAIARIVDKEREAHGFQLQPKESSGSVSNIDAIIAGEIEFGIAQADRQYQAVNGLAEWKGKGPQKDLRAVFSLYTESVTLIAGRDSGINAIHDLRGKRVDVGLPGSGTRQNAIDALDAAGIEWEKDIEAHEEKLDDRVRMLMHSELDAFFHTVGHPSQDITFATYSDRGARFIPLVNIERLLAKYPYYSKSVISVKQYPRADNDKDVETIGVKATFLTSAEIPEEVVYAVTKAVFNDLDLLGKYDLVLKTFSKENMLEGLTAPIHPGALRYYREIGLQVPPSGLSGHEITFAWNASASPNVGSYSVHYGLSSGNYPNKVFVGNQTNYTLSGLGGGRTYYIAVTALEANGTGESDFSDEIVVKIPEEHTDGNSITTTY
jgi:TRAP transporter TAXI family solute receptor